MKHAFILLTLLLLLPAVYAAPAWHNCCDVEIQEDVIKQLYETYTEETEWPDDYEQYRNKLLVRHLNNCNDALDGYAENYAQSLQTRLSITAEGTIEYDELVTFQGWSDSHRSIPPHDFKQSSTDGKEITSWNINPQSTIYAHLVPTTSFGRFNSLYNELYKEAKENCGFPEEEWVAMSPEAHSCLQATVLGDPYIAEHIHEFFWSGKYYLKGLSICHAHLEEPYEKGLIELTGRITTGTCRDGWVARKQDDDSTVCDPDWEKEIAGVTVDLDKGELLLDGYDSIEATFTYTTRDDRGNLIPYANRNVWGFGADTDASGVSLEVKPVRGKTNGQGQFTVTVSVDHVKRDVLEDREGQEAYVYSTDMNTRTPEGGLFHLVYADSLLITNVEVVGKEVVWQKGGAKILIEVEDPLNERKRYTIESDSGFRHQGQNKDHVAFETTTANEITLGWYPPAVSEEVRMHYTKRIRDGLVNAGLIVAGDAGTAYLDKFKENMELSEQLFAAGDAEGMRELARTGGLIFPGERWDDATNIHQRTNQFFTTANQAGSSPTAAHALTQIYDNQLDAAEAGVEALSWIEGTMGLFVDSPANIPGTVAKVGLSGLKDWYATVREMERVASSQETTIEFPITVTVEGLESSSSDTYTLDVPVTGYKLLLANDEWGGDQ